MTLDQENKPAPAQDELLPCPFCGRPAATAGKKATRFPWFKKVACSNDGCGAHFAYWHPDEWNRRATRPAQTEQQPEQDGSLNMEPEGANAYLVVDPDDNYHICYVVRSKDQALQHATGGLLAFGPLITK